MFPKSTTLFTDFISISRLRNIHPSGLVVAGLMTWHYAQGQLNGFPETD